MPRLAPLLIALAWATAQAQGASAPYALDVQEALFRGALGEIDDVDGLERGLLALRQRLPESAALSDADGRRTALARRILALRPASALAHEELALRAFLDFQWRRRVAVRQGQWRPLEPNRPTRSALAARDRALDHVRQALAAEPGRPSAHRLRMRTLALTGDPVRLDRAAQEALRAMPESAEAALWAGLGAIQQGRLADAEVHFRAGIDRLAETERHEFLTPARFVRPSDQAAWAADSVGWSARFWASRDPRLLTPENERWLEHAARLVTADLLFSDDEGHGWDTDRGDTYVRYGPPDVERWALGGPRDGAALTWFYPDLAVAFADDFRSGDFRFASSATGYDGVTHATSLAHTRAEAFWDERGERFPVPVLTSVFRGTDGRSEVVAAYAVPLHGEGPVAFDGPEGHALHLRTGAFLLDDGAEVLATALRTTEEIRSADVVPYAAGRVWTDAFTLDAAPGAYTLAVEAEQPRTGASGTNRVDLTVRDLSGPGLILSDLLLAYDAAPAEGATPLAGRVRRGDVDLHPAPWGVYPVSSPVVLYAEVYGLALADPRSAEVGRTRFAVEARLDPMPEGGAVRQWARRALGRRPGPGVSVRVEAEGDGPDDAQYVLLDVSGQRPGRYRLTFLVHDRVADRTVQAERSLILE